MTEDQKIINKDLILREKLAIDRTDMAIDRTFLSFVRTALYFIIAGLTVNSLLKVPNGWLAEIAFWAAGVIVLIIGIIKLYHHKRKLKASKKHIGNYIHEGEDDLD